MRFDFYLRSALHHFGLSLHALVHQVFLVSSINAYWFSKLSYSLSCGDNLVTQVFTLSIGLFLLLFFGQVKLVLTLFTLIHLLHQMHFVLFFNPFASLHVQLLHSVVLRSYLLRESLSFYSSLLLLLFPCFNLLFSQLNFPIQGFTLLFLSFDFFLDTHLLLIKLLLFLSNVIL